MATRDTGQPGSGVTRRDFLKTSAAATAVAGCGLGFAFDPEKAFAYESDTTNYKVSFTTCPYCSASCGQRVVTAVGGVNAGKVIDIYGDFESPFNQGGLCAKGAGGLQLVNNPRRLGAWSAGAPELAKTRNADGTANPGHHPVNDVFLADAAGGDASGIAWRRVGNGAWTAIGLDQAFNEIAAGATVGTDSHSGLVGYRGTVDAANYYNSKGVAFFGSSHMNNEPNYVYRKLIANFGTSNVEHQARI